MSRKNSLFLCVLFLFVSVAPVSAGTLKPHISSGGSTGSVGSVAGFETSLAGSIMVSQGSGMASAQLIEVALQSIEASAEFGRTLVITSVEFVGNVAKLTIEASAEGIKLATEFSAKVVEFTLTISREAFEASMAAATSVMRAMIDGTEVLLNAVAITVGKTAEVIGHSLVLASAPAVVVGVALNELGRELYASELP